MQAAQPAAGVMAGPADLAAVDHDPDTVDGQARLGDVGGQHDPSPPRRRRGEGEVLLLGAEAAVQRPDVDVAGQVGQQPTDAPDGGGPGEEHEHVTAFVADRLVHDGGDGIEGPDPGPGGPPTDVDGVGAAGAGHDRRRSGGPAQQDGQPGGLERGRHGQQPEIRAQALPGVEGERQRQVGLQVPLVDLVEDDQGGAGQARVGLEPTGEDPLGHDLDPGRRSDVTFVPGAVADGLADPLAQEVGHPPGRGPGGQAPRLEDHDATVTPPRLVEQAQRHHGGLARSRLGLEHGGAHGGQRVPDVGHRRLHGQPGRGDDNGHGCSLPFPSRPLPFAGR